MLTLDLQPESLPWSEEAESGVIGSLLLDNSAWDLVSDIVKTEFFYRSANRKIFEVIGRLMNSSKPADVLTVSDELEQAGSLNDVGGMIYLQQLAQYILSASNCRRYAEIVAERSLMRGLIAAAGSIKELAVKSTLSVSERLDGAQALLQALQISKGRSMPTVIANQVVDLLDKIQSLSDGTVSPGLPTQIYGLDRLIGGGLKGGKQIIVAARPSVGKSSFAMQICLNLAKQGYPAAFFSQEMSKDELTERAVSNIGHIRLDHIISGRLEGDEWSKLSDAIEALRDLPLYLDDQAALTIHDIAAKARMLKRQHGIRVIVIDYIQLCSHAGKDGDNRHHQIEVLSRGLKSLAKQLDIAIITLSQLNREVEKRTNGRPMLSDLKESGSIEEDADIVMMLSRNPNSQGGLQIINCDVPKNRQGAIGNVCLGFNGSHQEWHETTEPVSFKPSARRSYADKDEI